MLTPLLSIGGLIGGTDAWEWWLCKITGCDRPHLISFENVTDLSIDNLHLENPANHFIEAY